MGGGVVGWVGVDNSSHHSLLFFCLTSKYIDIILMLSVVLYDCGVLGRIKRRNITWGQKIKIHIDGWEREGGA